MWLRKQIKLCKCGCGELVAKPRNTFINGHNGRGESRKGVIGDKISRIKRSGGRRQGLSILCKCGCGQSTKPGNIFIQGHYIRTDHPMHHPEAVRKVSRALMGRPDIVQTEEMRRKNSEANKGKRNHFYGKHHTEEAKRLNSEAHKGEKSSSWRGGISALPYAFVWLSRKFKERIKIRDNHRCMNPSCRGISKILLPHHIDYDKENCRDSNLITLCNSCNSRANYDRNEWTIFYESIMSKCYGYEYRNLLIV